MKQSLDALTFNGLVLKGVLSELLHVVLISTPILKMKKLSLGDVQELPYSGEAYPRKNY